MSVHDDWKVGRGPNKGAMKPVESRRGMRWRVIFDDPIADRKAEKFFSRREDADVFDAAKKTEVAQGTYVDDKAGKVLVAEFGAKWIAVQDLRPSSLESYLRTMRLHIVPTLGRLPVLAVRRSHIQAWVKRMQSEGYAPNTVRMWYSILAGMFKSAVYDRIIRVSPCVKIALPAKTKKRAFIPTQLQVAALVRNMAPQFRLAVYLGSACGLRWSEIWGLTVADFDFAAGKIRVRRQLSILTGKHVCMTQPKTRNSVRDVDMPACVAKAARAHIAAGHTTAVTLPDHTVRVRPGKPVALCDMTLLFQPRWRSDWTAPWRNAITAAGDIFADAPDDFSMHDLRHYYVSLLIESGASVIEVQAAVGHADATTTLNTYGHLWPTSEGRAARLIDAVFGDTELDMVA